jgi:hypothetical protein
VPTIQTNDVETYYERRGEGPPIVFVHGAWVDHRLWTPQVEALGDDYEVIAYDVRGHGKTGGSEGRRYTIERFAADLKALVDALDLDRPTIVRGPLARGDDRPDVRRELSRGTGRTRSRRHGGVDPTHGLGQGDDAPLPRMDDASDRPTARAATLHGRRVLAGEAHHHVPSGGSRP